MAHTNMKRTDASIVLTWNTAGIFTGIPCPLHMGIYYKDGNPEQACVRERSVKKERGQNMKRHALFMAVVCVVVLMLAW